MPLPDELERRHLLDRLDARWQHPVTIVVAGAGFGKSTLLAQAVRANALEPRGIDVWYSCTPGDVDADGLGAALLAAVGADGRRPDLVGHVADALAEYSPIDVCLVLDDAHEIRPGSSGAELIDRLVRHLPANAHLVLAARRAPPGSLARLRAADRLVELSQDDLMFTRDETHLLASRLGRSPQAADALGGWPALVRLALASRPDVAISFAREEVLDRLSVPQRRALFALSNLGYADRDRVRHVVGSDIDLEDLAATVPLVTQTEDGRFRAHELWSAALLRVLEPEETIDLRARVVGQLMVDGDLARAGAIAVAHDDFDALAEIALQMISGTISALPIDTVRPWNRVLNGAGPTRPRRACWTPWSARPSTSPTAASTPTSTSRPRPSARAAGTTARSPRSRSVRSPPTREATLPDCLALAQRAAAISGCARPSGRQLRRPFDRRHGSRDGWRT